MVHCTSTKAIFYFSSNQNGIFEWKVFLLPTFIDYLQVVTIKCNSGSSRNYQCVTSQPSILCNIRQKTAFVVPCMISPMQFYHNILTCKSSLPFDKCNRCFSDHAMAVIYEQLWHQSCTLCPRIHLWFSNTQWPTGCWYLHKRLKSEPMKLFCVQSCFLILVCEQKLMCYDVLLMTPPSKCVSFLKELTWRKG